MKRIQRYTKQTVLIVALCAVSLTAAFAAPSDTYTKVPFANLDSYLKNTASDTEVNYIAVTGLKAADLKGNFYSESTSPLGKILIDNSDKQIALKFGSPVGGLTDMNSCFLSCVNLVSVADIPLTVMDMKACFFNCVALTEVSSIPAGVVDMMACFGRCASLTKIPPIPANVHDMTLCFALCSSLTQASILSTYNCNIDRCFYGCTNLTSVTLKCEYDTSNQVHFRKLFEGCSELRAGSIKVPAAQLQTYKDNVTTMSAQAEWFTADK